MTSIFRSVTACFARLSAPVVVGWTGIVSRVLPHRLSRIFLCANRIHAAKNRLRFPLCVARSQLH